MHDSHQQQDGWLGEVDERAGFLVGQDDLGLAQA